MNVFSAVVTLFLVLDPLGNIPLFLSVLKTVSPERRRKVLVREIAIAYLVLLLILFLGSYALQFLHLDPEAISIAGGIVLFLIALRMIFPREASHAGLLLLAITIAWALSGSILLASTFFYRVLGEGGLIAMARLMGMLLVTVAVQMLLNGLKSFLNR
jgi:multiple antibiotic resistance protein